MGESKKGAEKRRLHLDPDILPGLPVDVQEAEGGSADEGNKKIGLVETLNKWVPIVIEGVSNGRRKLFPDKREDPM
jgi:hypothetical protein